MREIRTSGSEGGATQANVSFLPLSEITLIFKSMTLSYELRDECYE
jgi:hypothetical protein